MAVSGAGGELDFLPGAVARVGCGGELRHANPAWQALLGTEGGGDELAWLGRFDEGEPAALLSALGGAATAFELLLHERHSGRPLRLGARFEPQRRLWLCLCTDESGLHQARRELQESRDEIENVFDAAADAMFMVDCPALRILRANLAAENLYGYAAGALAQRPIADLVAESARAGDFLRQHRDYVPLRFHRRADGSHMGVEIHIRYGHRQGREIAYLTVRDVSERTRLESVQRESDMRYRAVFDAAPYPILLLNTQGSIVEANPAAALLYGFSREEILGRRAVELIADEGLPRLFLVRPTLLRAGPHFRKGQRSFAAETTVSYIHLRGVQLAVLLVRDVTEARETLARLEQAEERWRFALEGAGDGVWDWNVSDGSFFRSSRWGEMLGYQPDESRRLNWERLLHPDDREAVLRRMEACLQGRAPIYEAEFRLRCKDGQYRWIAARGKVMARDVAGNPTRLLGTHRDISETRSLMESIRASERLWQFALEGHGDALWDWIIPSGEIKVRASLRAILGWPEERALQGTDIWPARIHPDDLPAAKSAFVAHLSGATPSTEVEFRLCVEDGSYRWVALRGKVMERDEQGRALRMIGTVRDVHERYLGLEREKRQQRELAHAGRLIHVGEMASALAHELNQPLTAVRNFSALVLRRLDELGPAAERIREPLTMIAEQSLRAGEIVHRVRGFVRKGGLVTAPVAINDVARDMLRFAEFEARAHEVLFELDLAEGLPAVLADQVQLEQVVSNLVKNGIDAMRAVPGERRLTIRSRPGEGDTVELSVTDTGEGLAAIVRSDPFAPFVTTKPDGVGLGLAICRSIIENHGGHMWVAASTAQGSTFCFSLPASGVKS